MQRILYDSNTATIPFYEVHTVYQSSSSLHTNEDLDYWMCWINICNYAVLWCSKEATQHTPQHY